MHTPPPGTNCAYVERVAAIPKLPRGLATRTAEMVVNMEWGDFASPLFPTVPEDVWVDCSSPNPGECMHEGLGGCGGVQRGQQAGGE